jgi:hypothetical protein
VCCFLVTRRVVASWGVFNRIVHCGQGESVTVIGRIRTDKRRLWGHTVALVWFV